MVKIAQIKSAHLQPDHHFLVSHFGHSPNTPNTDDTSDSDTDTPLLPNACASSFSRSDIGWLTTDTSWPTLSSVDFWLVSVQRIWEKETRFNGRAYMSERSVKLIICWLTDQSINLDEGANRWTQINSDRYRCCLFQIPDINIQLLINRYINVGTKRWRET